MDKTKTTTSVSNAAGNFGNKGKRSRNRRRSPKHAEMEKRAFQKEMADRGKSCFEEAQGVKNDPQWYVYDENVGKASGTFFYSNPLGHDILPEGYTRSTLAHTRVPGVMALYFTPTPGFSAGEPDAPVNVAAQSIYSFIRSRNSGSKNYEKSDLMMYLVALDSLYTAYADGMRAYGLANAYSLTNKFYPKAILHAAGWDYEALSANLAQMNTNLGVIAHALGSLAAPAGMTFYTRHLWMASHVWVDSPSVKAQSYLFVPNVMWAWSGRTAETGTELTPAVLHAPSGAAELYTPDSWMQTMLLAIQTLLADEDVGTISGDILKAFEGNLMRVGSVPADYVVLPEYSEDIVKQIQNAVIVGSLNGASRITQENNLITTDLQFNNAGHATTGRGGYLNLRVDTPTWQDNYEATRLTNILHFSSSLAQPTVTTLGSEFITDIIMYGAEDGVPLTEAAQNFMQSIAIDDDTTIGQAGTYVRSICIAEKFDWHPYTYVCRAGTTDSQRNALECWAGDADNLTVISLEALSQMNRVALTTELICDGLGTFNPAVVRF